MNSLITIHKAMMKRATEDYAAIPNQVNAARAAYENMDEAVRADQWKKNIEAEKALGKARTDYLKGEGRNLEAWLANNQEAVGAAGTGLAVGAPTSLVTYAGMGVLPYFQRNKLARILAALGVGAATGGGLGYLDYRARTAPWRENKKPTGEDLYKQDQALQRKTDQFKQSVTPPKKEDKEDENGSENKTPENKNPSK